jgi:hypothetical protein
VEWNCCFPRLEAWRTIDLWRRYHGIKINAKKIFQKDMNILLSMNARCFYFWTIFCSLFEYFHFYIYFIIFHLTYFFSEITLSNISWKLHCNKSRRIFNIPSYYSVSGDGYFPHEYRKIISDTQHVLMHAWGWIYSPVPAMGVFPTSGEVTRPLYSCIGKTSEISGMERLKKALAPPPRHTLAGRHIGNQTLQWIARIGRQTESKEVCVPKCSDLWHVSSSEASWIVSGLKFLLCSRCIQYFLSNVFKLGFTFCFTLFKVFIYRAELSFFSSLLDL